jgi:hypothetical protein
MTVLLWLVLSWNKEATCETWGAYGGEKFVVLGSKLGTVVGFCDHSVEPSEAILLAERLLAFQEGFSSMELATDFY